MKSWTGSCDPWTMWPIAIRHGQQQQHHRRQSQRSSGSSGCSGLWQVACVARLKICGIYMNLHSWMMAISNGRYIHKFKLSFSNGTYWNLHFPMVDIFIFPTIAKFSMCGDFPQKICSRQDDLTSKLFGNVTCPNEALATFITTGMVNHCCSTIVSPPNLFVQSGCQLQPTSWEPLLSENYSTKLKMSQNLSLETYNSINLYTSLYYP